MAGSLAGARDAPAGRAHAGSRAAGVRRVRYGAAPASAARSGQLAEPFSRYARTPDRVFGGGRHRYRVADNWARRPRGWPLGDVAGVAIDAGDNVFVYNRSRRPVQIYDRDGRFLDWWGDSEHTTPHGITIDGEGDVWLADTGDHMVKKYSPGGTLLLTLGSRHINAPGMSGLPFNRPTRVAVARNGDLYVSDGYGNNHVHVFDAGGDHRFTFGGAGSGPGEFGTPHAIFIDRAQRVYVCDRANNRIQLFDLEGAHLAEWGGLRQPDDLTVGPDGTVYVAELQHRISVWSPGGKRLAGWGGEGCDCPPGLQPGAGCPAESLDAGMVIGPHGIAIDSEGSLYVGDLADTYRGIDRGSRSIQKFVRADPAR